MVQLSCEAYLFYLAQHILLSSSKLTWILYPMYLKLPVDQYFFFPTFAPRRAYEKH